MIDYNDPILLVAVVIFFNFIIGIVATIIAFILAYIWNRTRKTDDN